MSLSTHPLLPSLHHYLQSLVPQMAKIDAARARRLALVASFVTNARREGGPAKLTFICTHNSRRSHMGQLWAAAAAAYWGLAGVETFSGGTEVTAFNPRAWAAMRRAGFTLLDSDGGAALSGDSGAAMGGGGSAFMGGGDNPRYPVVFAEGMPVQLCFSKRWDDPHNPGEGFAAIMTCTQADEACPLIPGAAARFALPYEDPKSADSSKQETATYDARAKQIATEMLYLFSLARP